MSQWQCGTSVENQLQRLSNKFLVGDGCWEWVAAKRSSAGYGAFGVGKKVLLAHRVIYELMVGPIPAGLELDHLCRNRTCVRPDHLEPVTRQENARRGDNYQRQKTHCAQGHSLDDAIIRHRRGGIARDCRTCWNAYQRARYRKNPGRRRRISVPV